MGGRDREILNLEMGDEAADLIVVPIDFPQICPEINITVAIRDGSVRGAEAGAAVDGDFAAGVDGDIPVGAEEDGVQIFRPVDGEAAAGAGDGQVPLGVDVVVHEPIIRRRLAFQNSVAHEIQNQIAGGIDQRSG